jgi:hypothetical protein
MMNHIERPTFMVGLYDHEGDLIEDGIFLFFGNSMVKVAANEFDYDRFLEHLDSMKHEIYESCQK